jgi:hypothetical protein
MNQSTPAFPDQPWIQRNTAVSKFCNTRTRRIDGGAGAREKN